MAQFALPDSDSTVTNWAEGAGDGNGNAFEELDEGFGAGRGSGSGPDDATTFWSTTDESTNALNVNLSDVTDPESSANHICRTRCQKDASGGRQLNISRFALVAQDPNDLIFDDTTNTNIGNTWTTFTHNLSGAEADDIDNYANTRMDTHITEVGGGGPRVGQCSAMEFECPDVVTEIPPGLGPVVAMQEPHHHAGSGALLRY